uniref:U4/U6 small nuclear ribonucleoprotein Prp4 putative n=1 Tax=Albugo laibachii Nc14 TaxID=890382 RepID=F0WUG3_9STRA|nr:U4/U6 small nuclear ribonucleoprotein Prp4 putative [Albugo laibachii Nc14]|eukprot:CCA25043.1 U4/U6 small nuclear ribonucleoprotein Prp4 putative [Albugo laibachii Nc14]
MTDGQKGIYFGTISSANVLNDEEKNDTKHVKKVKNSHANNDTTSKDRHNGLDAEEKEVLELSETSKAAQEKHAQILRRMEAERRARNIAVPTSVDEVILRLRQLGQPITLYSEGPADRRERLRQLLSQLELQAEESGHTHHLLLELQNQHAGRDVRRQKETQIDQLFYIPIKAPELRQARQAFFTFSVEKTAQRLKEERREKVFEPKEHEAMDRYAASLYITAERMVNVESQSGDGRPLSCVKYSFDNNHIATGSWSGAVNVWDRQCKLVKAFQVHENRVTGLSWHPNNIFSIESSTVCLCTGSADGTALLWSADKTEPVLTLRGHEARLGKVAFHPLGNHVGTTSFDHTWRLWDVNTGKELLLQEGHFREVYAIAFQEDGALVATGDLDGNGRVWDIRSGKSIFSLQGHSKQILAMDFAKNGFQVATGSDDRTARIWDIRQRKCYYTVPAHNGLVSDVKYSPLSNELFLTASYDATLKIWRSRDWKLLATLKGHDGKVMAADFALDEKHLVSCGHDRTFKFWAHENEF